MSELSTTHRPLLALGAGCGIGILGGLIGLGGAEFRLPLLIALFGLGAVQAVRFNVLISLFTVLAAGAARFTFSALPDLSDHHTDIASVAAGAIVAAWFGAKWLPRITPQRLMLVIAALLAFIGVLLAVEAIVLDGMHFALPAEISVRIPVAIIFGVGIGLVSSLLGVAGGELIIPTMVFIFGMDIKSAGSASILISTPSLVVGVLKHRAAGAYQSKSTLRYLVAPMALGSLLGAIIGAALLPYVATDAIKLLLAGILFISSIKMASKAA